MQDARAIANFIIGFENFHLFIEELSKITERTFSHFHTAAMLMMVESEHG